MHFLGGCVCYQLLSVVCVYLLVSNRLPVAPYVLLGLSIIRSIHSLCKHWLAACVEWVIICVLYARKLF